MQTIEVISDGESQVVRLPREFQFDGDKVSIRREGFGVILEPLRSKEWPQGFFEAIHIDDPTFVRPDQGVLLTSSLVFRG
ncbi:MAG: antitoxin [Planctomycetaceae bacterium]